MRRAPRCSVVLSIRTHTGVRVLCAVCSAVAELPHLNAKRWYRRVVLLAHGYDCDVISRTLTLTDTPSAHHQQRSAHVQKMCRHYIVIILPARTRSATSRLATYYLLIIMPSVASRCSRIRIECVLLCISVLVSAVGRQNAHDHLSYIA